MWSVQARSGCARQLIIVTAAEAVQTSGNIPAHIELLEPTPVLALCSSLRSCRDSVDAKNCANIALGAYKLTKPIPILYMLKVLSGL